VSETMPESVPESAVIEDRTDSVQNPDVTECNVHSLSNVEDPTRNEVPNPTTDVSESHTVTIVDATIPQNNNMNSVPNDSSHVSPEDNGVKDSFAAAQDPDAPNTGDTNGDMDLLM
jgi:hypothetical protein